MGRVINEFEFWSIVVNKLTEYTKNNPNGKKAYLKAGTWTEYIFEFYQSLTETLSSDTENIIYKQEVKPRNISRHSGIDAIFYRNHIKEGNEVIFLEHENNRETDLQEISNFAKLDTHGLKVFWWYYTIDKRNGEMHDAGLEARKQIILENIQKYNFKPNNFLIILGPELPSTKSDWNEYYDIISGNKFKAFTIEKQNGVSKMKKIGEVKIEDLLSVY